MERKIAMISLFAALIAILGLIPAITLMSGVPISAQSLGVMLCGTVLGARKGSLAVLLFLFLVTIGLPVLAGGRGGLGVFAGPTVGFLIGFPIAAFVAGWVVEKLRGQAIMVTAMFGAFLGGVIALYIPGIIGMAVVLDKSLAEATALALPFIPGDLIKVVAAGFVTSGLVRYRPGGVLSISD